MPESRFSSRTKEDAPVLPSSADVGEGGVARAVLRMRVVCSLPPSHQAYLFEEIRKLCSEYLRKERRRTSEVAPEELLSEIYQKLFGQVILENEDVSEYPNFAESVDPGHDRRVIWLVQEIGGYEAIGHRYEDILRQRFGRSLPGGGRRIVQAADGGGALEVGGQRDEQHTSLQEEDANRAWNGLLIMARVQFKPEDDVSKLLQLLAEEPDVLDDSNTQWPINSMVLLLNERFPPPSWRADRVDNAKRRLMNWIGRLMRDNGLDATDLEGLFARVARRRQAGKREPIKLRNHKLAN
jgi:hypothetical protein